VLGSSKLSAQEWSQGRHTVGVAQAVEAQSAGEKPRIARQRLHVPLGSLAKVEEHFEMGRSIFFAVMSTWTAANLQVVRGSLAASCAAVFGCHVDHGQSPAGKWSGVARPRARQERLCSTMYSFQPASGQR